MLHKPDERRTTTTSERRPAPGRPRRAWWAPVVVVAGAYAWLTAATRPFTTAANVAVGVALVVAVVLTVVEATTGHPLAARHADRTGPEGTLWPWWLAIGVLVGWELFNYFQSPRRSYPTMSSIYDHFARWEWAKALIIAAWLVLGWAIVTSFAKERRPE